ncbi:MAG: hypothetical protein WCF18_16060 [Chthoniobacteraceae bacterium]
MQAEINSPERIPSADSSAIKVAIIYEDFASGTRAKHFAERLAEGLESHCPLSESIWRSELLEYAPLAERAARAAADCDYLIISLRGDRVLPAATQIWIGAQLDGAAARGTALIFLADSYHGKWRVVEGTRRYLRTACEAKGVNFFSHAITAPPGDWSSRWTAGTAPVAIELPVTLRMPALLDA